MAPSRVVGGSAHSSPSSGIFHEGEGIIGNSHLGFGNTLNSVPGARRTTLAHVSGGDVSSLGPSLGASSIVMDANSAFPNGPNLQRSASFNTDAYRIPASPLSFASNNTDGQNVTHQQKKARLDNKQEEIIMQQMLQRQNSSMQSRNQNPHLQALIQQQRLRQQQQQQFLQSISPAQRAHILQQQQMRQQIHQQQAMQPVSSMKRPHDNGICSRRLMKYLYHLRQHPPENTIAYWRKFVAEYYSPRARKRWCLSLYNNVGNHSLGVFPQANMDAWRCDICGSKSGKGFEANFEVLPRLNAIKFASGVIDELLFLDLPRESVFSSGIMMLEYEKAVEESVYEQLRVVREGHLRIIFSPDLKILSWEFCARRHEELLPRRIVAPQVNQLLQVAQKCLSTINESRKEGVSQQDLQTNSNMVVAAGRQLAKTLELQSLNDLGFSKTYVRCLQIAEVVGSMKNLMDLCGDQKIGPIEGLKIYHQHSNSSKVAQSANSDSPNRFVNGQMSNSQNMVGRAGLSGGAHGALALTNYQNTIMMRQNSVNSNSTENMQSCSPYIASSQLRQVKTEESEKPSFSKQNGYGVVGKDSDVAASRNNSFKAAALNSSEPFPGNLVNGDNHKGPQHSARKDPLSDDMVEDIADAFIDNGFFSSDFSDNLDFEWKM